MKIYCETTFDITATGVTGRYRATRLPFKDCAGTIIETEAHWNRSRNQQRNWESITQVLGLRTQALNLTDPVRNGSRWQFDFEIEATNVYGSIEQPFELLYADCEGVPMILNLDETAVTTPLLCSHGSNQNIWFFELPINN
jgi:hypothetical protein